MNKSKLYILLACLLLSGCKTERQILCDDPIVTDGKLVVVDRQCLSFGDSTIGLIELKNTETNQYFNYTMNVVNGEIVFNQTTAEAIAASNSHNAIVVGAAASSSASASSGE